MSMFNVLHLSTVCSIYLCDTKYILLSYNFFCGRKQKITILFTFCKILFQHYFILKMKKICHCIL